MQYVSLIKYFYCYLCLSNFLYQMLSSIIQLFGSLIDFLTDDLREAMFASRDTFNPQSLTFDESLQYQFVEEFLSSCNELPDLFEKLLLDSRWEIKDSVLELVSSMVIYSTGRNPSCRYSSFS